MSQILLILCGTRNPSGCGPDEYNNHFNPLVTNRLSHPYHSDESILIFRGIRSNFSSLFLSSIENMKANRIAPDNNNNNNNSF